MIFVEDEMKVMKMNKNVSTFNLRSDEYLRNRPLYPQALYQILFANCREFNVAWDSGCGNGQVAIDLASRFNSIEASDINENQISNSYKHHKIHYSLQKSEKTTFPNNYFDLVCAAQCLHWFDLEAYFQEVKRVLKRGGLFSCWGYGFFKINEKIDAILKEKLFLKIDPFWAPGNRIVQNGYKDVEFPFDKISVPEIEMIMEWNIEQLLCYLNTWSAVKLYNDEYKTDIVNDVRPYLDKCFSDTEKLFFDFSFFCGRNT